MQALGWIIPNASSWVNNTKCHIHVLARLMYSRHSLELFDEWCQNHGEILYSGHSLATMRTVQNSKTLAGNISMLYHWLWVTVGLGDHIYKSTTYSKKFLQGVLKVLTISDTYVGIRIPKIWQILYKYNRSVGEHFMNHILLFYEEFILSDIGM